VINAIFSKKLDIWKTFNHEMTHVFFSVLSFNSIDEIRATAGRGGHANYKGRTNWVIKLSPYFFPLPAFIVLLLSFIVNQQVEQYINYALVVAYGFCLYASIEDFSYQQTDIQRSGFFFSTVIVVNFHILIFLFMVFYVQNDFGIYWELITDSVFALADYGKGLFDFVRSNV
jgi:hypothetical protein